MRLLNLLVPGMALAACAAALAQTPTYHLGRTPGTEEIRAWDIAIGPEGKELPPGRGTAPEGATIYAQKCAACHGVTGTETNLGYLTRPLVGGKGPRGVAGWQFATAIWDIINRSMPLRQWGSLSADEVYALTAFLLHRNGIIQESDVMDAQSLPKVRMPNRN